MPESQWNPTQYDRFRDERSQPFFDLLALVQPRPAMHVVDIGCGTGKLTRVLHDRLHAQETVGIDSSDTMLAQSKEVAGDGLRFEKADLRQFPAAHAYDLVFSNATLQWVSAHAELLDRFTQTLAEGGQLAIQMPANFDHPTHTVAAAVAAEEPFRSALHGYVRDQSVLPPEEYALLLNQLGYREQHVRLQVYGHHLQSREDVIEWVKGTLLVDYQQRMSADRFAEFLETYRARLLPRLAESRPYFYPFKRILLWARR